MQKSNQKFLWAGKTDPANSTFKHIFLMRNPDGRELLMPGYSKPLGGKETTDKVVALTRELYRLVCDNGYVFGKHKKYQSTTVYMEVYLNGSYTGIPDELLFTLYPDEYVFEKNEFVSDPRLQTFLSRLYNQAKEGKFEKILLNHKAKFGTASELFDISKKRFKHEQELYDWMQKRIREGHAQGEVLNFYLKYREKWLSQPQKG
jgi:hypothetical protein